MTDLSGLWQYFSHEGYKTLFGTLCIFQSGDNVSIKGFIDGQEFLPHGAPIRAYTVEEQMVYQKIKPPIVWNGEGKIEGDKLDISWRTQQHSGKSKLHYSGGALEGKWYVGEKEGTEKYNKVCDFSGMIQVNSIFPKQDVRILFLAANPTDTARLQLYKEIRKIDNTLQSAEFRNRFDLRQHWAVQITELQSFFLRHKPDIVHFSGHGSKTSEIILEDELGESHPVPIRALSQLFETLKDNVRCVVLNACYSEQQAKAIADHIDCVIGMSTAIDDVTAISFSKALYRALGFGRDMKTAFELACSQIDLENLGQHNTPKLLCKNSNPKNLVFVS